MTDSKRGTTASVEIQEIEPSGSSVEVFLAQHEGERVTTVDRATDEDGNPVKTEHTRPGTLYMYKPSATRGYSPRLVSVSAIKVLLGQGWHQVCPDCGKRHIDKNGAESTDPNLCTGRNPVAVRVCRVCRKRIYDLSGEPDGTDEDLDDVNVIRDPKTSNGNGASRTEASLNLHYWARHPRWAQMNGIPPLPRALADMVPAEVRAG